MSDRLVIGDVMRVSVALIEQIRAEPGHHSMPVKVVEIRDEEDGTKTLFLERVPEK